MLELLNLPGCVDIEEAKNMIKKAQVDNRFIEANIDAFIKQAVRETSHLLASDFENDSCNSEALSSFKPDILTIS